MSKREDDLRLCGKEIETNRARGQINPRIILGVFVVVVITGPLVGAAVDIQSSLASTPAFSWFTAGVIALLFVATIIAAALGLD